MLHKVKPGKASIIIVLALISIQVIGVFSVNAPTALAQSKTLTVPDDYHTISDAIANAVEYDTIIVKEGIYQENPVVDKPLCLTAEGNVTVVGEGGVERGARAVLTINSDDVILTGFTIKSQSYADSTYYATGINLNGDNANITGNTITGTYYGIFCFIQSHCSISNNNITDTKKDGIRIIGGFKNTIDCNTITGNAQSGIAINGYSDTITSNNITGNNRAIGLGAAYSVVSGNILANNTESGMYIATSNSTIDHNAIAGNGWGIYFTSFFAAPNNNTFYHNNFVDNMQQVGMDSPYNRQVWNHASEGGNHWGDYNVVDANDDGISELPYTVYVDNIDNYPLVDQTAITLTSLPQLPPVPIAVNGLAGLWHFDEVGPNGVSPDALGVNPVMLEPSGDSYSPVLVDGKIGNALRFNGTDYAYVLASPILDVIDEVTIEAWVYVEEFKDVAYSNIVVECERTPDKFPNRILGFAYNGVPPQDSSSPLLGALRGFMLTEDGVFNEIVTTNAVISLNEWVHVVFVRSAVDGMHIYINGVEQAVQVTSGNRNPADAVARGSEFYIGHDSVCIIDEVSISTVAVKPAQSSVAPIWAEWWFLTAIGAAAVLLGIFFLAKRNSSKNSSIHLKHDAHA